MLAQNFCKIILIDLILALDNFLSASAWYKVPFSVLDVTYTLTLFVSTTKYKLAF